MSIPVTIHLSSVNKPELTVESRPFGISIEPSRKVKILAINPVHAFRIGDSYCINQTVERWFEVGVFVTFWVQRDVEASAQIKIYPHPCLLNGLQVRITYGHWCTKIRKFELSPAVQTVNLISLKIDLSSRNYVDIEQFREYQIETFDRSQREAFETWLNNRNSQPQPNIVIASEGNHRELAYATIRRLERLIQQKRLLAFLTNRAQ